MMSPITQMEYDKMPLSSKVLLSDLSITWPAYNASENTGTNSASPTIPIENELLVRWNSL